MNSKGRLIVALLALASAGCGAPQSLLDGESPASDSLANLGWFVLLLGAAVFIAVTVLVVLPVVRRRGSLAEHAPHDVGGGQLWILVGGFAAPALILGVVFAATLGTLRQFPMDEPRSDSVHVQVVGHQWWWEVKYFIEPTGWITSANEIHIPVGRTINVALVTRDVIHSFNVPRLHGKVDMVPGKTNHIELYADRPGVYRGQCAEFCGQQHANMALLVVAHPPDEFEAWFSRERAPALEPTTDGARRGRQILETSACTFCHSVRGVANTGTVAPDLTHFGSRRTIAAGTLPNTRGHLQGWVVNAPSLKPGTQMPAMTQFTGEDLQALVDYLQSLQ